MIRIIGVLFTICVSVIPMFSQAKSVGSSGLKTLEMYSVYAGKRVAYGSDRHQKSCLNLTLLKTGCVKDGLNLDYGFRIGDNWDIFSVLGGSERSRMVDLGKLKWTDKFDVPDVKPWPELGPGQSRRVTVDDRPDPTSPAAANFGGDTNFQAMGDGHIAIQRTVAKQVDSRVVDADGNVSKRSDGYTPYYEIRKGHIYALHVVDPGRDYYLLLRADEVTHGDHVSISWRKI